jgi:hypothetical protein
MPAESAFSFEVGSGRRARLNRSALENRTLQHDSQEDSTVISKTTTSGVRIKSRIKAGRGKGGACPDEMCMGNHNQTTKGLRIKSGVRAGGLDTTNHNQTAKGLRVKSRVKAGRTGDPCPKDGCGGNHNQTAKGLRVKSRVKAGGSQRPGEYSPGNNHNQAAKGVRLKSRIWAGAKPDPNADPK